jgi:hypothetical protein
MHIHVAMPLVAVSQTASRMRGITGGGLINHRVPTDAASRFSHESRKLRGLFSKYG